MYEVRIQTTEGIIETKIKDIREIDDLLIQYNDIYIGCQAKFIEEKPKQKVLKMKKSDK